MDLNNMIAALKQNADPRKIGMIASHLGVVRATSRDGRAVNGIEVSYDHEVIDDIIKNIKLLPGIADVLVDTNEGRLKIGDEILAVAVAGDIREHVFQALIQAVNRIKAEASHKTELFD